MMGFWGFYTREDELWKRWIMQEEILFIQVKCVFGFGVEKRVVNVKETVAGGLVEPPKNAEVYPIPLQLLASRTSVMVGVVDGGWLDGFLGEGSLRRWSSPRGW
jgi:hypothetical protein